MPDRDTFQPNPAQRTRIEAGMSVDFWYIRQHPITGDLHPAKVELFWDEEHGDWTLDPSGNEIVHIAPGTEFFVTEDEAREALKNNQWKRENDETT